MTADKITSNKNDYIKLIRSLKDKKARRENGLFLVEGEKCVYELLSFMPQCAESVLVSDMRYHDLAQKLSGAGAKVYEVSKNVMDAVCDNKTPQGIAAVAKMPHFDSIYSGYILMLDGVQDPQNVGTMIRTADAAGCSCVVLSQESADCFSPKAVRASMGSIFHINIVYAELDEYLAKLKLNDYNIAAAHLDGQESFDFCLERTCLVIGNESRGVSQKIKELSTDLVRIPMFGKAESLNAAVAAGILLYKIRT